MRKEFATSEEVRESVDPQFLTDQVLASFILKDDISHVQQGVALMNKAHFGQFRMSEGDAPYVVHPLRVTLDVMRNHGLDADMAVTALLHDAVERNPKITIPHISGLFGDDIGENIELLSMEVGGIKKITKAYYGELEKGPKFPRLIKVYDRIDDLHSLAKQAGDDDGRRLKIQETMRNVVPLAADNAIASENLMRAMAVVEDSFTS